MKQCTSAYVFLLTKQTPADVALTSSFAPPICLFFPLTKPNQVPFTLNTYAHTASDFFPPSSY